MQEFNEKKPLNASLILFRIGIKDHFKKKRNKEQDHVLSSMILFNKNNNIPSASFELLYHAPIFKIK